jgi:S-adenosylhomocysteine hydrolase
LDRIHKDALAKYLFAHPGTEGLRLLRQQLNDKGVPLETPLPQEERKRGFDKPTTTDPNRYLVEELTEISRTVNYDLDVAQEFIAGAAARYFGRIARPDGTIRIEDVRSKLGAEAGQVFDLLLGQVGAQGAAQPSAKKVLSPKERLGPNAIGTKLRSPDLEPIVIPKSLMSRLRFQMRTVHPQRFAQLKQLLADRAKRRDPYRRVAEQMGKPLEIPRFAPIERMKEEVKAEQPLKGFKLLALQHLYRSAKTVIDAAVECGIEANDVTVLGKPYSGSPRVAAAMLESGYKVVVPSLAQSEYTDNSAYSRSLIKEQIERLIAEDPKGEQPIMVLDDGGQIARVVKTCFPKLEGRFRFVEQTQKGANEIRELGIESPVANIAESHGKKVYESPAIALSVLVEMDQTLKKLADAGIEAPKEIAIFGYGAIGGPIARALLERGFAVHVYDPSEDAQKEAENDGCVVHLDKRGALEHGHILLGASGKTAIELDDYDHLPPACVTFNAASANSELNSVNALLLQLINGNSLQGTVDIRGGGLTIPRELLVSMDTAMMDEKGQLFDSFCGKQVFLGTDENAAQNDRVVHMGNGRAIFFAKSGFVANLGDDIDAVPPRYIGLTHSLLFAGILAAAKSEAKGLFHLDRKLQDDIVAEIEAPLAARGESLLAPRFG